MSKTFKFKSGEETPKKKVQTAKVGRTVKQTSTHYCEDCGEQISKTEFKNNEGLCHTCISEY